MTIDGREVLDIEPEFSRAPTIAGTRASTIANTNDARRVAQFGGKHAVHTLNHEYLFTSKEQIDAFQDFFEKVGGKWKAFWLPSWVAELNPTGSIPNGNNTFVITPVDYPNVYFANPELTRLGHYVFLLHIDGTLHISKVTAANFISIVGDIITMETPVPRTFTVGDFIVGFCYYVRFAADSLSLDFDGPEQARVKCGFVETVLVSNPSDQAAGTKRRIRDRKNLSLGQIRTMKFSQT
jgi:hypothetical protein